MSYARYESYSDSGLQWLGEIPSHWEVVQSRRLFEQRKERARESDEQLTASQKYGIISQKKFMELESQRVVQVLTGSELLKHIEPNDFVISMRSFQGGLEWCKQSGCVSSAYIGLIPIKHVIPEFYNYLFKCGPYIQALQSTSNLVRDGQALRFENFSQVWLPIIPDEEQQKIANFLDHETAKIDTLIEKQQQLIKLLKEKRQAVISHAVTKGLNPNAPMKNSGVEWLGDVPVHWVRIKLKHITKEIIDAEHKTAEYFDDGEYLVCRTTNVRDGQLRLEGGKYTNLDTYTEWTRRGMPEVGDILFTREAPAGEACVYSGETPLCLGQRMVLFKLKTERVEPNFVLHSIYSGLSDDFIKQLSQGSTVAHFNMADIQNIPLFEPPMEEQKQINEYLVRVLSKYDGVIKSASDAINLMQERRTALISAAVTGKIDVRNWSAD